MLHSLLRSHYFWPSGPVAGKLSHGCVTSNRLNVTYIIIFTKTNTVDFTGLGLNCFQPGFYVLMRLETLIGRFCKFNIFRGNPIFKYH